MWDKLAKGEDPMDWMDHYKDFIFNLEDIRGK